MVWVREHCYLLKTPLLIDPQFATSDQIEQLVELHQDREIYKRVDPPEPGDIMVFDLNHVGVVVEGGVLAAVKENVGVVFWDWRKMGKFFSTSYAVRLT